MRIYFDTEFTTLDASSEPELISAGFVAEDGQEWYAELGDFKVSDCSPFVREVVLPLLGNADAVRVTSDTVGPQLATWLSAFGESIDLVTDYAGDWYLLNDYVRFNLRAMPHWVRGQVWQRSGQPQIVAALAEIEVGFWQTYPGKRHHALYDAKLLKLLAERQALLVQSVVNGVSPVQDDRGTTPSTMPTHGGNR